MNHVELIRLGVAVLLASYGTASVPRKLLLFGILASADRLPFAGSDFLHDALIGVRVACRHLAERACLVILANLLDEAFDGGSVRVGFAMQSVNCFVLVEHGLRVTVTHFGKSRCEPLNMRPRIHDGSVIAGIRPEFRGKVFECVVIQ